MKGFRSLIMLLTLLFGLVGCALQQTCCTCYSSCCDGSGDPGIFASEDPVPEPAPITPEVETSPSDLPATSEPATPAAEAPAAPAPATSDEAASRSNGPAARTATRPPRRVIKGLIPAQNPRIGGFIEG